MSLNKFNPSIQFLKQVYLCQIQQSRQAEGHWARDFKLKH